uniref:Uncharacterized protein n=1 Tax=Chelydra serpentina TaxID=8475 RepID=A0A8C3S0R2_CHESE
MSNPSGSPEDVVKQRGRDGKMRREDLDDSQPEGKRLKLGNEGRNSGKEGAAAEEIMPCLGREDPAPQAGGEGKSVSEVIFLALSWKGGWGSCEDSWLDGSLLCCFQLKCSLPTNAFPHQKRNQLTAPHVSVIYNLTNFEGRIIGLIPPGGGLFLEMQEFVVYKLVFKI